MKMNIILPPLLATVLFIGPVLAKDTEAAQREVELALEREARAAQSAAARAQLDMERQLKAAQEEFRLAQAQAPKALAAAGPALRRAFGLSYNNVPESPLVVTSVKPDPSTLGELREDLNVMAKLVGDAISDEPDDGSVHRAMGIVVKWLPGVSANNNFYLAGFGAIIQGSVRFPLLPPQQEEPKSSTEESKNSAWEAARRELYGGKDDENTEIVIPPEKREEYNAGRVEELGKTIIKALENVHNFRRLAPNESVTVVVRNRNVTRSELVMFQSSDAHGHVRRSDAANDATMTVRVKKADADALADGKITEEEFKQRALVAIY